MSFLRRFSPYQYSFAVIIAALLLLYYSALTGAFSSAPQQGRGYDPLTDNEIVGLQRQTDQLVQNQVQDQLNGLEPSRPIELLLIERHEESAETYRQKSWPRRADTYYYDYNSDRLIHYVINLESKAIDQINVSQSVQLPLTRNELQNAIRLVMEDITLRRTLNAEFERVTDGQQLTSAEQLQIKGFVFGSDVMPDRVNEATQPCGLHRCAQLLIYTQDNIVLELLPIVDLSRQLVTQDLSPVTGGAGHDH